MNEGESKKEKLKEVSSCVWPMYQHVLESRSKLENKLGIFLAINSAFLLVVLELTREQLNAWSLFHIVAAFLSGLPIILLLLVFISRPPRVPWIDMKSLTKHLDSGEFYKVWLLEMFASAHESYYYKERIYNVMGICQVILLIAFVWLCILFILELCSQLNSQGEKLFILILMAGGISIIFWQLLEDLRKSPHQKEMSEVKETLSNWLDPKNS